MDYKINFEESIPDMIDRLIQEHTIQNNFKQGIQLQRRE